jgi:hypothetical protein
MPDFASDPDMRIRQIDQTLDTKQESWAWLTQCVGKIPNRNAIWLLDSLSIAFATGLRKCRA